MALHRLGRHAVPESQIFWFIASVSMPMLMPLALCLLNCVYWYLSYWTVISGAQGQRIAPSTLESQCPALIQHSDSDLHACNLSAVGGKERRFPRDCRTLAQQDPAQENKTERLIWTSTVLWSPHICKGTSPHTNVCITSLSYTQICSHTAS